MYGEGTDVSCRWMLWRSNQGGLNVSQQIDYLLHQSTEKHHQLSSWGNSMRKSNQFTVQVTVQYKRKSNVPITKGIFDHVRLESQLRFSPLNGIVPVPRYTVVIIGTFTSTTNRYTADQQKAGLRPLGNNGSRYSYTSSPLFSQFCANFLLRSHFYIMIYHWILDSPRYSALLSLPTPSKRFTAAKSWLPHAGMDCMHSPCRIAAAHLSQLLRLLFEWWKCFAGTLFSKS